MTMKKIWITILIYIFTSSNFVFAKDFGNQGANYPVAEESILLMIQRKLAGLDLKKEEEKMQKIADERVKTPAPVSGLTCAKKTREFWHDPTYIVSKDIILPNGEVLYKAGEAVNPLKPSEDSEVVQLNRRLFFIDERIGGQVKWLKEQLKQGFLENKEEVEDKIILVGGSPFRLQDEVGQDVYFDQSGELTTKFGIKAIPAFVVQDGLNLKIVEVAVDPATGVAN